MSRLADAITKWLPLSAAAFGLTLAIGAVLNLPLISTSNAAFLAGAMVFGGFAMRSFGKESERYKIQKGHSAPRP